MHTITYIDNKLIFSISSFLIYNTSSNHNCWLYNCARYLLLCKRKKNAAYSLQAFNLMFYFILFASRYDVFIHLIKINPISIHWKIRTHFYWIRRFLFVSISVENNMNLDGGAFLKAARNLCFCMTIFH